MAKELESTMRWKLDISDLEKSIKDANRDIQLANAEFKKATGGVKGWASSIDGLKAKLKQLNATNKSQKAILTDLRGQYEIVKREMGEDSEEAKKLELQIAKQEAAVAKTKREIKSYSGKLKEAKNPTRDLGDAAEDAGKDAKDAGEGFTVFKGVLADLASSAIKYAITQFKNLGRAALDAYKQYDEGADNIIKRTGATGEAAKQLKGTYKNILSSIVTDFSTAGDAIGEVSTRFGITGDQLENVSEKFLKFAQLNNTDVVSSIDSVQKALSSYGLGVDSIEEYLDVMNRVAQDTGVSVDKLSEGIISNGAAFQEMGLDINQATYFMGQLEKSGANSETVLNGMRKALKNAAKDGVPLNDALTDLENTILNGKNGVDGLTAAYDLFGKSGDQIYSAVKNGSLSFKDLAKEAGNAAGSVDSTYEATLDGYDKVQLALQKMRVALGEALGKVFAKYGPQIEKFLTKVADGAGKLIEGIVENGDKIISVLKVIAPLMGAAFAVKKIAPAIKGVKDIAGSFSKLSGSAGILSKLAGAGPYVAIAAGAAVAVAGIAKLVKEYNKITAEYQKASKERADYVSGAGAEAEVAEVYAGKLDNLISKEEKTAGDKAKIKEYVDLLNETVPNLALAYDEEADSLNKTNDEIRKNIDNMREQAIATAAQEKLTEVAKEAIDTELKLSEVEKEINDIRAKRDQFDPGTEEWVGLNAQLEETKHKEEQLLEKQQGLNEEMDKYSRIGSGTLGTLSNQWKDLASQAEEAGIIIPESFKAEIDQGLREVPGSLDELKSELKKKYGTLEEQAKESGVDIGEAQGEGQAEGLDGSKEEVLKAIDSQKQAIEKAFKGIDQTKSGEQLDQSFIDGIRKKTKQVYNQSQEVKNKGVAGFNGGNANPQGSALSGTFRAGILSKLELAGTNAGSVKSRAITGFGGGNANPQGSNLSGTFAGGILEKLGLATSNASTVATQSKDQLNVNTYTSGTNFTGGFAKGIGDAVEAARQKARDIADAALKALSNRIKEGSPSRLTMISGRYFTQGFAIGIAKELPGVRKAVNSVADAARNELDKPLDFNLQGVSGKLPTARKQAQATGNTTNNNSKVVNYNFYQTNTSPEALDPTIIYRQTKSLLWTAKNS